MTWTLAGQQNILSKVLFWGTPGKPEKKNLQTTCCFGTTLSFGLTKEFT